MCNLDFVMHGSLPEKELLDLLKNYDILTLEYGSYLKSEKAITCLNKLFFEFHDLTRVYTNGSQRKIPSDLPGVIEKNSTEIFEVSTRNLYESFLNLGNT